MENTEQMSLLEIAVKLVEEKGCYNINDLIKDTLSAKGIDPNDTDAAVQLYVDMTASSKFVYMGNDEWDLKANQHLEAFDRDGSSFISKEEEYIPEPGEEEEIFDEDEEISESDEDEEDEDDDRKSMYIDDADAEDEESEKKSSDDELEEDEDVERYSEDDYSEDDYNDEDFNEDEYNDLMDDYEDMYDDK